MDELVSEFLVETKDGLEVLDNDLISLEKDPDDRATIDNIFRAMHTIKGTCGFLGFQRLEKVAHAGENILDKIRDGKITAEPEIVSIILESVDQIKYLVEELEENEQEPDGQDDSLISRLNACAEGTSASNDDQQSTPAVEEISLPESMTDDASTMLQEGEAASGSGDSADLQKLFDETECLVDVESAQPEQASAGSGDSDELQKLFDETEPLVDQETPETKKESDVSVRPATDTKELQQLFDETKCLVEMEPPQAKKAPAKKPEPKKETVKKAPAASTQSIRVNLDVLEELMQQASELVLTRNQLLQILRRQEDSDFASALHQLNNITTELQERVMKTRMQPVGNAWSKLPRIVRDLANELNKKIELVMEGADTELDRQLLDAIKDPLTHMVRNSADHGLETPDIRRAKGKPEQGTIQLKAYQGGGYIIIEISDDGAGINPEKIREKAVEKGVITEQDAENMNDMQVLQLIFAPGFSTAEKITSVSGRGVGMDVVRSNIEKISGTVDLQSSLGKGSTFTIKIPLTLAIMPVLEVSACGQSFAIPQINVVEVVKTSEKNGTKLEFINDKAVLRLRGKLLPLISLADILQLERQSDRVHKFIVVCEVGGYNFGVIVGDVNDTEEIVVKAVAPVLKNIDLYAGYTILGSGDVIMILDPSGLARLVGENNSTQHSSDEDDKRHLDDQIASFVLFKAGDKTPKLIPLELLSRLEEMDVSKIELSHGKPVIQYRDNWMHICKINDNYDIPEEGIQEFLVFINGNRIFGIAVEEVMDIVRSPMKHNLESDKQGYLGSMVVNDKTCDVIDSSYYYNQIFPDAAKADHVSFDPAGKRILVVDDSAFFRKFIPPELEEVGYIVEVAKDGSEALKKLESSALFTAVVTDMNMPGMSGQELFEACRADQNLEKIPFIALTSYTGDGTLGTKMEAAGFDGYVSKTQHVDLVTVLANVLSKQEVAA